MNVAFPALVLLVLLVMLVKRAAWGPQKLFARVSLAQLAVGVGGVIHHHPDWESFGMTVSLCLILGGLGTAVLMLAVANIWMFKRLLRQGKGQ